MQHEPRADWCLWRRVRAVSGDPCSILCSIPITWEGMQRKLRLSALPSDSLPSQLCPEQSGCPWAGPAAPEIAQPYWDGHDAAGPVEGVCVAAVERPLQQRTRKGFAVTKIHTSCKRSRGVCVCECGEASRGVWTPFSDVALGRAQPYLQKGEEEENGVSHRKPGGRILHQLNHQDSLQISSKLASQLHQCCVLQAQGLWHLPWVGEGRWGGGGTEWLVVQLVIPKARLICAGLVVRDMRVLKYF